MPGSASSSVSGRTSSPTESEGQDSRGWSNEKDEVLREGVLRNGTANWEAVAEHMLPFEITDMECQMRWEEIKDIPVKGPWSPEEDAILQQLVERFGPRPKKWSLIASQIPGRAGKQCRERWLNHLDTSVKKGEWTEQEDHILCDAQRKLGNKWSEIAKLLPGRAENSVKNRFNSLITRRLSRSGSSSSSSSQHHHMPSPQDAQMLMLQGAYMMPSDFSSQLPKSAGGGNKGSGPLRQKTGPKSQGSKAEKPTAEERGGRKKNKSEFKAAGPEPKKETATAKKDGKETKAIVEPQSPPSLGSLALNESSLPLYHQMASRGANGLPINAQGVHLSAAFTGQEASHPIRNGAFYPGFPLLPNRSTSTPLGMHLSALPMINGTNFAQPGPMSPFHVSGTSPFPFAFNGSGHFTSPQQAPFYGVLPLPINSKTGSDGLSKEQANAQVKKEADNAPAAASKGDYKSEKGNFQLVADPAGQIKEDLGKGGPSALDEIEAPVTDIFRRSIHNLSLSSEDWNLLEGEDWNLLSTLPTPADYGCSSFGMSSCMESPSISSESTRSHAPASGKLVFTFDSYEEHGAQEKRGMIFSFEAAGDLERKRAFEGGDSSSDTSLEVSDFLEENPAPRKKNAVIPSLIL